MSIAIGEQVPTKGVAAINTFEEQFSPQSTHARSKLFGQVPQHDTLWPHLTGREHLELFASLKGIVPQSRDMWIRTMVDSVGSGLSENMDKLVVNMSGGTKRKVAFLTSLVGKPKILFLDEPTTGYCRSSLVFRLYVINKYLPFRIDPKAKRNIWNLLRILRPRVSTILTTHSMDEADALASRIGIMVNGLLACIGTQQYIKHTYGKGYLLEIHMNPQSADQVRNGIRRNFTNAVLKESFDGVMERWEVSTEDVVHLGGLGKVFEVLEELKKSEVNSTGLVNDFCFGQMTLDMVFVKFATSQLE